MHFLASSPSLLSDILSTCSQTDSVYIANFRTSNVSVFVKHLPQGSIALHCASTKNNNTWVTIRLFLNAFFHLKELFPAWEEKSTLTQISNSQCDKGK